MSRSTAAISRRSTRTATRSTPERVAKPDAVRVLMSLLRGRPRGQLLRRSASGFRRQCRQGDGRRQAGLSGGQPHPGAPRGRGARRRTRCRRGSTTSCARRVHEVIRLTPNIVEVVVRAPMAARAFQPGQFYRLQNYETLAPRDRRHDPGDGGAGADRRLGRPRAGAALDHRARNGRLVRSLRAAEAGRAGDPDGADRHADRDARRARPCCWSAAGSATRCCSRSARRCGPQGSRVLYFAGYKTIADRYKVEEIERAADIVVWCCDEAPGFAPARPQDRAFVGNIVEAIAAYGAGELGPIDDPARRGRPHHRDRLGRDDERGRRGAPRRARAAISGPAIARSRRSTRRCNA